MSATVELSQAVYLRPIDVHYSQDSISCNFSDGRKIGETLDNLVRMGVFVIEIPMISVVRKDDKYYTKNNRRLWVYRQMALMNRCDFIPVKLHDYLPQGQFTTMIDGYDIVVRGNDGSETLQEYHARKRDRALDDLESLQQTLTGDRPQFTPRFGPEHGALGKSRRRKLKALRKLMDKKQSDAPDTPRIQIPPYEPEGFFGDPAPGVVFGDPATGTLREQINNNNVPRPQCKRPLLSSTFAPMTDGFGMHENTVNPSPVVQSSFHPYGLPDRPLCSASPNEWWPCGGQPVMTPAGDGNFGSYYPPEPRRKKRRKN